MNQIEKNAKNLVSDLILDILVQIWSPKIFAVGFISTRYRTLLQTINVCNFKVK